MKITSICCSTALALAMLVPASKAFSTDLSLALGVAGTILDAPAWRDGASNIITSADFNFGNVITGSASTNVDSSDLTVVIKDSSKSGQVVSITLTTPTSCTIGGESVTNSHVKLVFSNTEFAGGATLSLTESNANTIKLRFVDDGGYGDKAGAVSCSGAGSLVYQY